MKTLLSIIACFVFVSCTAYLPAVRFSSFVDFTKYNDFYISQSDVINKPYKPLGLIYAYASSGVETDVLKSTKKDNKKPINSSIGNYIPSNFVKMNVYDGIDELIKRAKEEGANGVISLKIQYEDGFYDKYTISAMAIKLEQ